MPASKRQILETREEMRHGVQRPLLCRSTDLDGTPSWRQAIGGSVRPDWKRVPQPNQRGQSGNVTVGAPEWFRQAIAHRPAPSSRNGFRGLSSSTRCPLLLCSVRPMTTIALAVLTGIVVLVSGNLPWAVLLAPLNLRVARVAPWAVLPMAIYLWCYWKYIGGSWGSKATSGRRRANLRANLLSTEVWGASIAAGLLGFAAIGTMLVLMARLVKLPDSAPLRLPTGMPSITAFVLLAMSSVVAGVTEEAAFRGYMQGPIERRYGLAIAILVNGTAFG